jgi:hypothetical protein
MIAYQVASKATRDALFLSHFPITTLPPLLTSSAIVSIVVVLAFTRVLARWGPARVMPSMFLVNAALLLGVWGLSFRNPPLAAIATYFHVAVLGPIVVSCFWSLVSERFDARTARREISRIGALGTLGGLMGGVLADRVAHWGGVLTMLPVLAGLHIVCAVAVMGVGSPRAPSAELPSMNLSGGLRLVARDTYLRRIGLLTAAGTLMAALLDYAFKAHATATWTGGPALVRVFSVFYTGTALLTFIIQTAWGRRALERLGAAGTVALLPGTVALGGLGALIVPGFWSVAFARGGEAVVRNSLFRSGYELLFAPVAPEEKRVTKTIADVGFDRLGDALGGGLVAMLLMLTPNGSVVPMLVVALLLSIGSLGLAVWFRRGYVERLASGLVRSGAPPAPAADPGAVLNRASVGGLDLSQTIDLAALTQRIDLSELRAQIGLGDAPASAPISPELWDLLTDIADLRSGEAARVREAIARHRTPDAERLPHLLPLLARDDVASSVLAALRDPPPTLIGSLGDFLLDPARDLAARRRVPRILARCPNPRAAEVLFLGLEDPRFEIRLQCGRALLRWKERGTGRRGADGMAAAGLTNERVFAAVLREVDVGRGVWQAQQSVRPLRDGDEDSVLDRVVSERAGASLEHVFTLLSLALPRQPLEIAFRGLHAEDEMHRGMALEYLESVLPPPIRERLWPYLERSGGRSVAHRDREEILTDLLRANESMRIRPTSRGGGSRRRVT